VKEKGRALLVHYASLLPHGTLAAATPLTSSTILQVYDKQLIQQGIVCGVLVALRRTRSQYKT
jgi:hypothetical protein